MERELAYLSRRASEEREAAMSAAHPVAREAHLEMARRYDDLLSGTNAGAPSRWRGTFVSAAGKHA